MAGHDVSLEIALERRQFLACLMSERVKLLALYLSLDEATLTSVPVEGEQMAKDLLAHIAAWDALFAERTALVVTGNADQIVSVDLDERNARLQETHQQWSLQKALDSFVEARNNFLQAVAEVPHEEWRRPVRVPWGDEASVQQWAEWRAQHDMEHAAELRTWRQRHNFATTYGPPCLLLEAFETSHQEMKAFTRLVPKEQRDSLPLEGAWTLKDVVGHVTDWEAFAVNCLQAGRLLDAGDEYISRWNKRHAEARRNQSWQQVWSDYCQRRQEMMATVEGMSPAQLAVRLQGWEAWSPNLTPYRWALSVLEHEWEHTRTVREALLGSQ